MTDRRTIKLPEPLATDLEAHKREDQTWPAFVREDVVPALEGDGGGRGTDVAERLDAVMNKLEQLEGAQADTVSKSLELADISNHDVLEQLDTVERAAKEATSAAQSAEKAINEVVDR